MEWFISWMGCLSMLFVLPITDVCGMGDSIKNVDIFTEEVRVVNHESGIELGGSLSFPREGGPFPAVILISGSGALDRNSEIFGHKPFYKIAKHLNLEGYAVLRMDDRGFGESEGDYQSSRLDDFVLDYIATLEYLLNRPEIQSDQIGFLGHSMGGLVAAQIAAQREDIAFLVLMGVPGIPGGELMLMQKSAIERAMGFREELIEAAGNNIRGVYEIIEAAESYGEELKVEMKAYLRKTYGEGMPSGQIEAMVDQLTVPWLMDFIRYNPNQAFSRVQIPVLALNGTLDLQVPHEKNLQAIQSALEKSGNRMVEVKALPGRNHLMQKANTGLPAEYALIDHSIDMEVLISITQWLDQLFQE